MVSVVAGLVAAPAGASGTDPGSPIAIVVPRAPQHWDPLTDSKWELGGGQAVMTERGTAPPGPRRPFEYAVVTEGPVLGSLSYRAEVRLDEPVTRQRPRRDPGLRNYRRRPAVLLRAPVAGQHDLPAQRDLRGGQRRPAAHRRPVERHGLGAPPAVDRRPSGTRSASGYCADTGRDRGLRRRLARAADDGHRHAPSPRAGSASAPSTTIGRVRDLSVTGARS